MKLTTKQSLSLLVLVLVGLSALLYNSTISLFPAFIHSWTQSDRYALALSFLNNGFDFFHPATFNLQTINGITRIDFPINEYLVALLMKLFGTTAPIFFRLYNLLISIIGLVYLFLLSLQITKSEIKSWFVVLFVFLSPVYVYYQAGFIPSIPAISCVFVAYYYYFSYKENFIRKYFLFSILFFTLAALMRMPFVILLFALVLQQGWMALKQKKINFYELFISLSAFLLFASYYFYNIHVGRIYGNMFLDYLMPAKNYSELKIIVKEMYNHWCMHYFTVWHYLLLLVFIIINLFSVVKQKTITPENKKYWFNLFIISCGTFIYFLLMAKQYYAHDYYFLDSFFIPTVFLFIYSLHAVPLQTNIHKRLFGIVVFVFLVLFLINNKTIQAERYSSGPWDRTETTRQNFIGTEKYLDSVGISKDAKILVIDAYTTNVPLILMNRRGYTVLGTSTKNISTSLFWCKWDYVAIQDMYLVSDVIKNYPLISSLIERVGGTGKVSFYKRNKNIRKKSLKEFLDITPETIVYNSLITFDTVVHNKEISSVENLVVAKNHVSLFAKLDAGVEYGATLTLKAMDLKNKTNLKVLITSDFGDCANLDKLELVSSIANKNETVFYQNFSLSDYFKPTTNWQKMQFQFSLASFKTNEDELKIYLWNPGKINFYYDNWEVIVYK